MPSRRTHRHRSTRRRHRSTRRRTGGSWKKRGISAAKWLGTGVGALGALAVADHFTGSRGRKYVANKYGDYKNWRTSQKKQARANSIDDKFANAGF